MSKKLMQWGDVDRINKATLRIVAHGTAALQDGPEASTECCSTCSPMGAFVVSAGRRAAHHTGEVLREGTSCWEATLYGGCQKLCVVHTPRMHHVENWDLCCPVSELETEYWCHWIWISDGGRLTSQRCCAVVCQVPAAFSEQASGW